MAYRDYITIQLQFQYFFIFYFKKFLRNVTFEYNIRRILSNFGTKLSKFVEICRNFDNFRQYSTFWLTSLLDPISLVLRQIALNRKIDTVRIYFYENFFVFTCKFIFGKAL